MFLNPDVSYEEIYQKVEQVLLKLKVLKQFQVVAYLGNSPVEYWILFLACKELNLILFMPNQRQSAIYQNKNLDYLKPVCLISDNFKTDFKLGRTYKNSGVVVQTSGSSGTPKFCLISFTALDYSAETVADYFDLDENDIWQLNLPCYHVGGIGVLNRVYLKGAKVNLAKELNGNNQTIISVVPSFLNNLENIASYKKVLVGGSGVSVGFSEKISKQYNNIYFSYGLTEFSSTVAIGKTSDQLKLLNCNQAKVENQILYLKGDNRFTEYLGFENSLAEYFQTSDYCTFDNDSLHILGRLDRIVNSGGEKIAPEMIENLITENFTTKVAVVKKTSEKWGERPVLLHDQDIDIIEAKKIIEENLGRIFIPDDFIKTPISLTAIGKVNYQELQNKFNQL